MKRLVALLLLAAAPLVSGGASAHHSFAMFDSSKQTEMEGTIKEFAWTNPHVAIKVAAKPEAGKPEEVWSLEATSPGNLSRMGWNRKTFNPGDRVKVTFRPLRTGEPGGQFMKAILLDSGKEVAVKNELPPDAGKY